MAIVYLDFETYYRSRAGRQVLTTSTQMSEGIPLNDVRLLEKFSLRGGTTEEYIRSPLFQVIGVAVAVDDGPVQWFSGTREETQAFLDGFNLHEHAVAAHNAMFDAAILNWIFNIRPKAIIDTLAMASLRGLRTTIGGSLAKLSEALLIGRKGDEIRDADGMRREHFTPEGLAAYGKYCKNDTVLLRDVYKALRPSLTMSDFLFIDYSIRMFTEPQFVVDAQVAQKRLDAVVAKKEATREALTATLGCLPGDLPAKLRSNDKFAELLREHGVEPGLKPSPSDPDAMTFAFAKTDPFMEQLIEGDDPTLAAIAEARVGEKSRIEETRLERFIGIAERGLFPVPLKISGAHTGRYSGGEKLNVQALPKRKGGDMSLRRSLTAPKGHVVIGADSSQIECLRADTLVLTDKRGWVQIQHVSSVDKVWDGYEWVAHQGAIRKGRKPVISYGGVVGTADHIVYTDNGRAITLAQARDTATKLLVGAVDGVAVRAMDGAGDADTSRLRGQGRTSLSLRLWGEPVGALFRHALRQIKAVPGLQRRQNRLPRHTEKAVPSAARATQRALGTHQGEQVQQSHVRWCREPLRFVPRVRDLLLGFASHARLQRAGGGSDRHSGALRTREYPVCFAGGERAGTQGQSRSALEWAADECREVLSGFHHALLYRRCHQNGGAGGSPRGNNTSGHRTRSEGVSEVWDIVNAGPRHRFTVYPGVIVSNCRALSYLAGNEPMLQAFRDGADPYCVQAASLYGGDAATILAGYKAGDPTFTQQRQVAKSAVLGAGFGIGPPKFMTYCWVSARLKMTFEEARATVYGYRNTNPAVKEFWARCGHMLDEMHAGREGGLCPGIHFEQRMIAGHKTPAIVLPNGFLICYPGLRRVPSKKGYGDSYSFMDGRKPVHTYGASVCENIVQGHSFAILRDQAERIFLRTNRYPVHNCHDEWVYIVPEEEAGEVAKVVKEEMSIAPSWAEGIPLACETGIGANYADV